MRKHTCFLSFFVNGFPDFVNSGGGMGGAGVAYAFSANSASGPRREGIPFFPTVFEEK